jgi:tRNA pseudouridine65 synthase
MLSILFQDSDYVAINKPAGMLVHRTSIARDATQFALQLLRDQIDQHVYPVHRIDRKTSGVLLFALNEQALKKMQAQWQNQKVKKYYLAIVRGKVESGGCIDYEITNDKGKKQSALTKFDIITTAEISKSANQDTTSCYSFLLAEPITGRMHQIRKHFKHLRHPIIGDRPYGCNKQNRLFKNKWQINTMMLHAYQLTFQHPDSRNTITITAPPPFDFMKVLAIMDWELPENISL